jgi:NADPH-dependent curcumin reductase CurA
MMINSTRIPVCGQISLYNEKHIPLGPRIQPHLLTHSALIVHTYADRFIGALAEGIKTGVCKSRNRRGGEYSEGFHRIVCGRESRQRHIDEQEGGVPWQPL